MSGQRCTSKRAPVGEALFPHQRTGSNGALLDQHAHILVGNGADAATVFFVMHVFMKRFPDNSKN